MKQKLQPGEHIGKDFIVPWFAAVAEWHRNGKSEQEPTYEFRDDDGISFMPGAADGPGFDAGRTYRFPPPPKRTTTIKGKTYVLAEKVAPKDGTKYFYVASGTVSQRVWLNRSFDLLLLEDNNVFLAEEDAKPWFDLGVRQRGGM